MRRKYRGTVGFLAFFLLLPTLAALTGEANGIGNLLVNGGFEDGLNGWSSSTPAGSYSYNVISDGAYLHALEYSRWNSGSDGGTCGQSQELDVLVSDYDSLYVELDVKVISNSLPNSGWWSDTYGGRGEFPALVSIIYEDENGSTWIWDHAFFPDDDNEYYGRTNFEYVVRNQWNHYVSPSLTEVTTTTTAPHNVPISSPTPHRLKSIFVGGTGWDYTGMIDNVKLWGSPKATVDINPDTLNLKSRGKWITAYIELPNGYDVNDVDVSTILLNNTVSAEMRPVGIGDEDGDGIPDLMVKFSRSEVKDYVEANLGDLAPESTKPLIFVIRLVLTGQLYDGTPFQGTDAIRAIWHVIGTLEP